MCIVWLSLGIKDCTKTHAHLHMYINALKRTLEWMLWQQHHVKFYFRVASAYFVNIYSVLFIYFFFYCLLLEYQNMYMV